jgi:hypothetical protein
MAQSWIGYVSEGANGHDTASEPAEFAVPMTFLSSSGELRLLATRPTFATARDLTVADLVLEAFLPADADTSVILRSAHWLGR